MFFERTAIVLILLPWTIAGSACSNSAPETLRPQVLIVGIDGLEPSLVAELIAAGRLPVLASIAEKGVLGRIDSMIPTYSPVIWTTIATGQMPDAHGIMFFHDEQNRPYTSNSRKVPALWNIVSDGGLRVNCVSWWNTWPAETIDGCMLSSYAAQAQANLIWKPGVWDSLEEQTWPRDLWREIKSDMVFISDAAGVLEKLWNAFPEPRDQDPSTPRRDLDPISEKSVTDLGWSYAADLTSTAVVVRLLEHHPADLSLVYLAMTDVAGHRFWNYHEPEAYSYEMREPARTDFANYIELAYIEADRMLGEIIAAAPSDANILVLSDHGMHAYEEALDDPNSGTSGHHPLGPPGVFAAMGPLVRSRGNLLAESTKGRLGHVLEVAPLVLRMLSLPVPEHWPALAGSMDLGQVLDENWRRGHPLVRGPNRDAEFRPATPPRLPMADVGEDFLDFLRDIGYAVGGDEKPDMNENQSGDTNSGDTDR